MSEYPPKHHAMYWLVDELNALGATAEFAKDARTCGCWGAIVNGRIVVYLIDNRWQHERIKEDPAAAELLKRGALVMCAQKADAERVGGKWLPLAVSPEYRQPDKPIEKLYEVCTVGYVRDAGRQSVLAAVARRYKLCVLQGVFGDAAVSGYWESHIGLNVPTQYGNPLAYDVNMRVFEILATGTPLLTNALPELEALGLDDGDTCMTYANPDELLLKVEQLLNDDALAKRIGDNGERVVRKWHTYAHRAQTVLSWLNL